MSRELDILLGLPRRSDPAMYDAIALFVYKDVAARNQAGAAMKAQAVSRGYAIDMGSAFGWTIVDNRFGILRAVESSDDVLRLVSFSADALYIDSRIDNTLRAGVVGRLISRVPRIEYMWPDPGAVNLLEER